jgi:Ca2+-binding EF-hand superfamily protein
MKGLQGERLRQSFKYLDADQDGFIQPEQFKRIILVSCLSELQKSPVADKKLIGNCWS